jgi:ABC-type multidrug transport system fused ATPase/permease subunit
MFDLIDNNTRANWYLSLCQRWMHFRMGLLGAVFVTTVAAATIANGADASVAGLTITVALQFANALSHLLLKFASTAVGFNAVERALEYVKLPTELESGIDAPNDWPSEGRIEFDNLVVAYDDDLLPVLKHISFCIQPRERLGIVGRTGAGKTTLAYSLLRFVDPREGTITIDGIDIAALKLHELRSSVTIIPQDPFLFSGSLRSNLDIHGTKSDDELKLALHRVRLTRRSPDSVSSGELKKHFSAGDQDVFSDLNMPISDGGMNLSHGQRQLICLARAILAHSKILVLDEATSAVDNATDSAIQQSIRTEFSNSTLIVIAHRLSTVADFDKLLVLSEGAVLEFGTPAELIRKKGMFWEMVCQSAEREQLEKMMVVA